MTITPAVHDMLQGGRLKWFALVPCGVSSFSVQ